MKPNSLIKIVLVGDYSIFRIALRMLLETEGKIKVIGEVSKINEVSGLAMTEKPDLILVDLPDNEDGADLFPFFIESESKLPVLILTGSNDLQVYQKCLRLGISGLVLKEKSAEVLFKAIEKVCQGEFWFDRSLMEQTIKQLIREKQSFKGGYKINAHDDLTEREKQVVNLICKGLKNKGIAEKLFITETTVRHHLTSIFEKLAVTSRLELVIYAFKHCLEKIPTESLSDNDSNFRSASIKTHI